MTDLTKRRTTGWVVDFLLFVLACLVAFAMFTARPANAAEACQWDYDEQVAIGLAMGISFGEVVGEEHVVPFLTGLGLDPTGVSRIIVVLGPEKMALGIERDGCLQDHVVVAIPAPPPEESTAPSPTLDSTGINA